eukprot:Lithocolla_globosa_v1_NODE_10252_length_619_cov_2.143617.p1 type:complete len:102 gc:universal NODE_10252_length_619_cov_2.143617:308-3(-)
MTCHVVAPGEGKSPLGLWVDEDSEEKAFPGVKRRPTRAPHSKPVTYSQQVRWELRNIDPRVTNCIDNIFFKLRKLQIKYLCSRIHRYNHHNKCLCLNNHTF